MERRYIIHIAALLILFYVNVVCFEISGQTITLSGVVTEKESGDPVDGVIVRLTNAQEKILAYTITDMDGCFSLKPKTLPEGSRIVFSHLSYSAHSIDVKSHSELFSVVLTPQHTNIREVAITASSIRKRGDTLVYNVNTFADEQDRTISDVLKKMPGIEVSESGQIKYNGEAINKLYIDGADLLDGQHNLATKNISAKDVKSVEVMENHHPVKALDGIEHSDQAAINLRLQEDAKLRWAGSFRAGGGFSPALWDGSLFAMRITGKYQSMESFKTNNIGDNPAVENLRFNVSSILGQQALRDPLQDYLNIGSISAPLGEKRTRFNESLSASSINSFKLSDAYNLKANINYTGERLTSERSSLTDYLDPNIAHFIEQDNLLTRLHDISATISLNANTSRFFLKNDLEANFGFKDTDSRITGSSTLHQQAETPSLLITNNLQYVRRFGDRTLTLSSLNRYYNKPHSLAINDQEHQYLQDINSSAFQSLTETSLGWKFGRFQLRTNGGFELNIRNLESALSGFSLGDWQTSNNVSTISAKVFIRPHLTYEHRNWRLSASLPTSYHNYSFSDKSENKKINDSRLSISPSFSLRYAATAKLELLAGVQYGETSPNENYFYNGIIMNNHRYLSVGLPLMEFGDRKSANLSIRYRDPFESLFVNGGLSLSKGKTIPVSGQIFLDNYIINTYLPTSTESTTLLAQGGISKGLNFGKILIALDGSYMSSESFSVRNDENIPFQLENFSITPRLKGTLLRYLTAEYALSFNHNTISTGTISDKSSYNNIKQSLSLSLSPTKRWRISTMAEHYHNLFSDGTTKNTILLDAGMRWVFSDKAEIQLTATNLLDQRQYSQTSYGSLSETIRSYLIRPRNILLSIYMRF